MPIGGSAYYDKFKKRIGATARPGDAAAQKNAPAANLQSGQGQLDPKTKSKRFVKTIVSPGQHAKSGKKNGPSYDTRISSATDPGALDHVVSQILDLAQRVHAVAGQAEAAILRAEAAVLKAEVAVGKAEAAGSRADASFSKCDVAVSRAEAAAFKSDASAKRAELSAGKAGLAAGKSEYASSGRDVASVGAETNSPTAASPEVSEDTLESAGEEDNRTKEINSPISQIAVMSMKLRSGMRQIEEDREKVLGASAIFRPEANLNMAVGREDLASGLVSLDNDTALPRVAPFIMSDATHTSGTTDNIKKDETEIEASTKGRS